MEAQRASGTVLVVDDDALLRLAIVDEFKRAGWSVLEAATGEGALVSAKDCVVDVLFTDIQLGGDLTGWDLAEALDRDHPGVLVIYASGTRPNLGRMLPGAQFVSKPYDMAAVVRSCGAPARKGGRLG